MEHHFHIIHNVPPMATDSMKILDRFMGLADQNQVLRMGTKLQQLMESEPMQEATVAVVVSSIIGWYCSTLDHPQMRIDFEQLIEAQLMIASMPEIPHE